MTAFQTFVAIGDSFTRGIGDPVGGFPAGSALDQLAEHLRRGNPAMEYVNLARRGLTTRAILDTQLGPALERGPDLVSIIVGANDHLKGRWDPQAFRDDYVKLLSSFPAATILTMLLPDFSERLPLPREKKARFSQQIGQANQVIQEESARFGAVLVRPEWGSQPGVWSEDGTHPNARGYALAAREMTAALELTMAGPPSGG